MADLSKMRKKNSLRQTILSKLFVQYTLLSKRLKHIFFSKNSQLEAKHRRCLNPRSFDKTIKRIWNSIYERSKVERLLQKRVGSQTEKGSGTDEERTSEGRYSRVGKGKEESKIEEHKKKIALANIFSNPDFQYFIEYLSKEEELALNELVTPITKPQNVSYNEYSWFKRGEINCFNHIRSFIQSILIYKNKSLIKEMEGGR